MRLRWPARMAWRETRGAWRRFVFLLACITLGVGALTGVGSFAASLERGVGRSAKSLMGGDVEIRSTQPLSSEVEQVVASLRGERVAVMSVRELIAMAQAGDATQLVELKAVEPGYPFYGRLLTEPDRPLPELIGGARALVHESLLSRLGLKVGDRVRIGEADFTITGVIREEPDRSLGIFSLGPRVMIGGGDLAQTGLVKFGSRVRYRTLFRLPELRDANLFREELSLRLPDPNLRISTFEAAQPGLRRFWGQLTMYLGLAGLVSLMVGGIGVAVSVRAFVREKIATIATLKCLGAEWRAILSSYLLQTALLGLIGSLLGAALGSALQLFLSPLLAVFIPVPVDLGLSPIAILRGLAMGTGVTLLFALWPLMEIKRVRPALILRREVEPLVAGKRPWAVALPIAAGLSALVLWQAGSWKVGGLFLGGLAASLGILFITTRLIVGASKRIPRVKSLPWRHGVTNLHRPGSLAGAVLTSLALAVMFIVAIALLERSLRAEIAERSPDRAPAFFFIGIQPDQAESFARVVTEKSGTAPELIPVVRSRLARINGSPVAPDRRRDDAWYLTREYVLTWAEAPPRGNTVVDGRWWTREEAAREPLISVEDEIAKNLGITVGSSLTFDILGVPVTARVVNLRRVDWQSLNSNFFVIFSPGALDGAPGSYIATARARREDESAVQSAVVSAFPNVTAIPVREVLERVTSVLDQIAVAVRFVAGLAGLAGIIVMAGALSVTRRQRLYQTVILKALGATRGLVARVFAVEYALLGTAAGLAGTLLASLLAWALLHWVMEVPWTWSPGILLFGVLAAAALSLAVGFLATYRLLGEKPLAVLRSE